MTGVQTCALPILILSASRRTDLPGFHAESCAARVRGRVSRLRTRELVGVVFWSRHVRPFLPGGALHALTRRELENPHLNLTVTGLGGGPLEPGVPATRDVVERLPELVDAFHGEGFRIRWRFDPLLAGRSSLETFGRVAEAMAAVGVETCTFSFPATRSLKGDLTPAFERAGIRPWREEDRRPFVSSMAAIARSLDIRLLTCNQPENARLDPWVAPAACVPRAELERGHPRGARLDALGRDRSQRSACNCVESEDIGRYETDICRGGCAYCYSKAGGQRDLSG